MDIHLLFDSLEQAKKFAMKVFDVVFIWQITRQYLAKINYV